MTATAIPARRERPAARAVPWTRLAWVTWRQHRGALIGAAAFLGAIAVYLAVTGHQIHQAHDALVAAGCPQAGTIKPGSGVPVASATCQSLTQAFLSFYGTTSGPVGASGLNAQSVPFMLLAVPVLLGAFAGAPVLARELESGTFRFAWTQGAGRRRLAAARLIPLAVLLTAAAYGLSALFSWYFTPFFRFGNTGGYPMQLFGNLGVDFAAWALFSFTLAAFLGVLLRRAVAATALSLAVTTVLDVVTMMVLRQHLVTPATVTGAGPAGKGPDNASVHLQLPLREGLRRHHRPRWPGGVERVHQRRHRTQRRGPGLAGLRACRSARRGRAVHPARRLRDRHR
jgi:ABC-2 family transporter